MRDDCRLCNTPVREAEIRSVQGRALFLTPTEQFEERADEVDAAGGASLGTLPFYLNAIPCFGCGVTDVTVVDLPRLLEYGADLLPLSDRACPSCGHASRGPWTIECDGLSEPPLAFLGPKYGAALRAHLCTGCGLVRLRLDDGDTEARKALSELFPEAGACPLCAAGKLRETYLDMPYSGRIGLFDPAADWSSGERAPHPVPLHLTVCDHCGDASPRVTPSRR